MNKVLAGMQQQPTARTWNGDVAHATTWDKCLDLFGAVGSLRKNQNQVLSLFKSAFDVNIDLAVRVALWARDVRGGAGERESFRTILTHLAKGGPAKANIARQLIPKIEEVGRFDDLLVLMNTPVENDAIVAIAAALYAGNGLCAKWMPRKGPIASKLRAEFGVTPKQYRKLLVELTNVVETQMCAKKWSEIEFGKLPSLAAARYQKAFGRNAPVEYAEYAAKLETGEAKINASAIFPHDVILSAKAGNDAIASAQWKALPDYMAGTDERVLAMVDVSGSMGCGINGGGYVSTVTCMDVAIGLGIYCAERNTGPFKDNIVTFTTNPRLVDVSGASLSKRVQAAKRDVGYDTNFDAAYEMILNAAKRNNAPQSDMPTMLLVLSDMQFNPRAYHYNATANDRLKQAFEQAGYTMPKMVYWNLNATAGNSPITVHDSNTALVSGFSPAILKAVMSAKDFNPAAIMMEAVCCERYDWQQGVSLAE